MSFQLLFILILAPASAAYISPAPDPGLPQVEIYLLEAIQTAEVGPGDDGIVTFNGKVKVSTNPFRRIVVTLAAEDTWGSASVAPLSIAFRGSGVQSFKVSVKAPSRESSESVGLVTVTGRWVMYPGSLSGPAEPREGVTGLINIAQFYSFSLCSPETFYKSKPGSTVSYELIVSNKGNGNDTYTFEICNDEKMRRDGFKIKLSESSMELSEKEPEGVIKISVEAPRTLGSLCSHGFGVMVSSKNGKAQGESIQMMSYGIKIHQENMIYTIEFSIILFIIIIGIAVSTVYARRWLKARKVMLRELGY